MGDREVRSVRGHRMRIGWKAKEDVVIIETNGEGATFWCPALMTLALKRYEHAYMLLTSVAELFSSFQTVPKSLAIESVVHIVPHDVV